MNSSIKIFKKEGIVVMSNIYNNSITDKEVFNKIAELKVDTLLINNLDGNAMYYYIHKHYFPTITTVVYLGGYHPQDVNGLYEFKNTLVTKKYIEKFAGKFFRYMTFTEEKYYENIAKGLKLDKKLQESLSIATTENAIDYFKYIQTEPIFEIIE